MIDTSLEQLSIKDIDKLDGLALSMAIAIYCLNWKWYFFSTKKNEKRQMLLDCPPEEGKVLDKNYGTYIGDNRWVFIQFPKFQENLSLIFYITNNLIRNNDKKKATYIFFLREVVKSDFINLVMSNSEQRCKALLKTILFLRENKIE